MPTAGKFRTALTAWMDEAGRASKAYVGINSGELHRMVGGYPGQKHRMPVCCAVMESAMREGDVVVSAPPKGRGASLTIRYKLPRSMADSEFRLQFEPAAITSVEGKYLADQAGNDEQMLAAGKRIREGACTKDNLAPIIEWKSPRVVPFADENGPDEIADALRLAVMARTERAAIAVLVGLRGVDIPVASTIMTAIYPDRYTVIDFRALRSLGRPDKKDDRSIGFYLEYLNECRRLAEQYRVTLRQLDRALWQWSKDSPSN